MATGPSGAESKAGQAEAVSAILRKRYPDTTPILVYSTPFELLVAVILSAQTTDNQVNQVTPELFARFPTPEALAGAPLGELESIVHPTGFFRSKARNIKKAAAAIVATFGGSVPEKMEALLTLPGVGRKTAHVIRGVLFGHPAIIVDTHFKRVVTRIGLSSGGTPEAIEKDIARLVSPAQQFAFSMAVNNHGRQLCTSRSPACERCPVRPHCDFGTASTPGALE